MNYSEAIEFLYRLVLFGAKLGLEKVLRLAELMGNPQRRLKFIHVAGTNGKGSTCAMLESIYRTAGLRVGLFTSPHLVSFRERIQVNRTLIPESAVVRQLQGIQPKLAEFSPTSQPTFFEVVTVMALLHFAEEHCDLIIWETGLGGRLDATNIVTPLASVITNIQLDHQQWLGQTEAEIAREKAGIIKPCVPVITSETKPEIVSILEQAARNVRAPFIRVTPEATQDPLLLSVDLPLPGDHQRINAALAIEIVRRLRDQFPVSDQAIRAGLTQVHWPGRMQILHPSPERTLVLDGAHNVGGTDALIAALNKYFPGSRPSLIFGVLRDKDWGRMCQMLVPLAGKIYLPPVSSERSTEPELLADFCRQISGAADVVICQGISECLDQSRNDPLVVVTGSLHFIGDAMQALDMATASSAENARDLNDWLPQEAQKN